MHLINYLTRVQFGFGSLSALQQECDALSITRPLIITDRGVRSAGLIEMVTAQLRAVSEEQIFDETPPNPNEATVRKAANLYQAGNYDGLIAVGGGSAIDLAKGVAVCATHEGPLS